MERNNQAGPSTPYVPSSMRRATELGSSDDQNEGATSNNASSNAATPSMTAGPASAARTGRWITREVATFQRRTRQRTSLADSTNLAPTIPGQREQDSGRRPAQEVGQQSNSSSQSGGSTWPSHHPGRVVIIPDTDMRGFIPEVGDPLMIRSRLTSELRNIMGLQGRGGSIQYRSHTRVPGNWWLFGVTYQPDVVQENYENDEVDGMRLDIDTMSYEELLALGEQIGIVSTGLDADVIMQKMKQQKFSSTKTEPSADGEACCICQEEFVADDNIGSLDCGHQFHVDCIKEWLIQKNSCPICKKTALAT